MEFLFRVYKRIRVFVRHHWLTTAFLFGFLVDLITLNQVDHVFDNIVLFFYVTLAMTSMLFLYAGIAGKFSERVNIFLRKRAPLAMQYSFGGLLSGMLIFYGRSSSLEDSWPFLLIIVAVIYGNETVKNRSGRLLYNLVMFFVGLFAYTTLVIPVALGEMGPWIFVGSGLIALIVMYLFFKALSRIIPNFIKLQKRNAIFLIGLIYLTLNFLYFTNIMPPIPLSLKHVGIYHNVVRFEDGTYELTYEQPAWWQIFRQSDKTFHFEGQDNAFCFAAVFAPTRLETQIYHRWEYWDEAAKEWKEHGRFTYSIQGGRGDGYRGYTLISNYLEGRWRCTIETERGQVIGREEFTVRAGEPGQFVTRRE